MLLLLPAIGCPVVSTSSGEYLSEVGDALCSHALRSAIHRANGGAAPKASSSSLSGDSGEMDEAELFGGMDIDESKPMQVQRAALGVIRWRFCCRSID